MFDSKHIYLLLQDPIEQDIIEYISELEELLEDKQLLRKQRGSSSSAKKVLSHFLMLYQTKYGTQYKIASISGALVRITNFMKKYKLTPDEYCKFLDVAFGRVFNDRFVPGIGHICSSHVLNIVFNDTSQRRKYDFKKLRESRR